MKVRLAGIAGCLLGMVASTFLIYAVVWMVRILTVSNWDSEGIGFSIIVVLLSPVALIGVVRAGAIGLGLGMFIASRDENASKKEWENAINRTTKGTL